MKHLIQLFLAIQFCIAINTSTAMNLESELLGLLEQKQKKAKILTEITCIKDPFAAHYLTNNRILISGKYQCSVVDPTTNTEIKRIFDNTDWPSQIAVHPNKTKFALNAQQKITIYNAKTYESEHTIDCYSTESMCFSPIDDILAICQRNNADVIIYNYKTNNTTTITVPEAINEYHADDDYHDSYPEYDIPPIVSFHPTQPLINIAWKTVYSHDLTTSTRKPITKAPYDHIFCEHSPDGSFIALGTNDKISCIKPGHMPHFTVIPQSYPHYEGAQSDKFFGMAIHPNGNILMILSRTFPQGFRTANYYDVRTSECITKIPLSLKISPHKTCLSFSPNGKKLLLVAVDLCAELKVPFKVFYKDITKKQLLYLLFLLKNYTSSCADVEMPQDVYFLIRKSLLEAYKS